MSRAFARAAKLSRSALLTLPCCARRDLEMDDDGADRETTEKPGFLKQRGPDVMIVYG